MSYILDAIKKSEREKTLGQVPTLETVISDGAKKVPVKAPWWINFLVFAAALIVLLLVLYFTGLIQFKTDKQPPVNTVSTTQQSQSVELVNQTSIDEDQTLNKQADLSSATDQSESQLEQESSPVNSAMIDSTIAEPVNQQSLVNENTAVSDFSQSQKLVELEPVTAQSNSEQSLGVVEPEVEQQQVAAQASEQAEPQVDFEQSLHQDLRDISVNVVSFSSDPRQRFIMLDLTIFKEGDNTAKGAKIIEIQKVGAIVEYQNKRYFLKP